MDNLQLKFLEHGWGGKSAIPAGVLAAALVEIERICKIMGELTASPNGGEDCVETNAILMVMHPPEQGCYDIPLRFGAPPESEGMARRVDLFDALSLFLSSVEGGDLDRFMEKFENGSKINEILTKLSAVAGLCTEGLRIVLKYKSDREFDFYGNRTNLIQAKELVNLEGCDQSVDDENDYIIAKLKSVDSNSNIIEFKHSLAKNPLIYKYDSSDLSLRNDIEKISGSKNISVELHGEVKFKKNGSPAQILSLRKMKQVDLRKIEIKELTTKEGMIEPVSPLAFYPELKGSGTLYEVDIKPFGDILFEHTREFLVEQVHEYLSMVWDYYAMEEDKKLDSGARELKETALTAFKFQKRMT